MEDHNIGMQGYCKEDQLFSLGGNSMDIEIAGIRIENVEIIKGAQSTCIIRTGRKKGRFRNDDCLSWNWDKIHKSIGGQLYDIIIVIEKIHRSGYHFSQLSRPVLAEVIKKLLNCSTKRAYAITNFLILLNTY